MDAFSSLIASAMPFFQSLLRASWQAAVLAGLVVFVQWSLRGRLSARWRYALWALVLVRLLVPTLPPSRASLYNLAELFRTDPITQQTAPRVMADTFSTPVPAARAVVPEIAEPASPVAPVSAGVIEIKQQPAAAAALPSPRWTPTSVAFLVWAAVAAMLGLRLVLFAFRAARAIRRFDRVTCGAVLHLLGCCAAEMGLGRRRIPQLLSSPDIAAPALMGFFRPRILLPRHVLDGFSCEELRLILLHELVHLRRRDIPVNWLLAALQVAHWFNPVLSWAFARVRADRELACDELVLAASQRAGGDQRHAYGQTVIRLLEVLSRGTVLPGMVGILEGTHLLMKRRISMIANFNSRRRGTVWAALAVLLLAAVALTGPVRGQDKVKKVETTAEPKPAREAEQKTIAEKLAERRRAEDKAGPKASPDNEEQARLNAKTKEQLSRPLPEMRFDAVPFSDAVDFLRDVTGVNVFVNWRELEAIGFDRTAPVTIRLQNVPAAEAIRLMLRGVSNDIEARIESGVLVIAPSGAPQIRPELMTRAYEVRDLVGHAPANQQQTKMTQLIDIIKETVASDTWRDNGGSEGTIKWFNTKLLITASESRHREVEKLLRMLREDDDHRTTAATRPSETVPAR